MGGLRYAGDETAGAVGAAAGARGLEAEESAAFKPVLLGMLGFELDEQMSAEEVARLLPSVCGIGWGVFDVGNLGVV